MFSVLEVNGDTVPSGQFCQLTASRSKVRFSWCGYVCSVASSLKTCTKLRASPYFRPMTSGIGDL